MSEAIMIACRIAGVIFSALAVSMLAEFAKFGDVSSNGKAWPWEQSAITIAALFIIGFLLTFGGADR